MAHQSAISVPIRRRNQAGPLRIPATRHLIMVDRNMAEVLLARDVWYFPQTTTCSGPVIMHETIVTTTTGQVIVEHVLNPKTQSPTISAISECVQKFFSPLEHGQVPRDYLHILIGYDEALMVQRGKMPYPNILRGLTGFLDAMQPVLQSNITVIWSSLLQFNYLPDHTVLAGEVMRLVYAKTRNLMVRNYTYDVPAVLPRQRAEWVPRYKCEVGRRILDAIAAEIPAHMSYAVPHVIEGHPIPFTQYMVDSSRQILSIEQISIGSSGALFPAQVTPIANFVTSPYVPSWYHPNPREQINHVKVPAHPRHVSEHEDSFMEDEPLDLSITSVHPTFSPSSLCPADSIKLECEEVPELKPLVTNHPNQSSLDDSFDWSSVLNTPPPLYDPAPDFDCDFLPL